MTDCLFCRIVARQSPVDIEYEDDHAMEAIGEAIWAQLETLVPLLF